MDPAAWIVVATSLGVMVLAAGDPPTKPPEACGYATFIVCAVDTTNPLHGKWVMVAPDVVASIRNPPESPRECVKIATAFGRGVYVVGTAESVTEALRNARICRAQQSK